MPSRLTAPVLTLDVAKMHQIDPRNVESLFGMWTVFSQCSQSLKDGKRLENMSWRLWARETLCCPAQPDKAIVPTIDVPQKSQVPSLSNSIASEDESSEDEHTPQQGSRQRSYSSDPQDSALSKSRGIEPHLSANTLKKIVVGIQEKAEFGPLSPSIKASLPPLKSLDVAMSSNDLTQEDEEESCGKQMQNSTDSCISGTTVATSATNTTRPSDHRNSDTSVSSDGLIRSGSVVHGFSPVSTSFRAKALQGMPMPQPSKLAPQTAQRPGMFQLGASSEDDDSSFEAKVLSYRPHQRSSLSQSITKHQLQRGLEKKNTSFRDIVEQRRMDSDAGNDEGAIASSDEDDDESAIDDEEDEDGDWEDSPSDDEKPAAPEQYRFRRVESRPDLVSRPSMLSMQLDQNQKRTTSGLQNENSRSQPAFRRSRTTSPTGPSLPGSPDDNDDEPGLMMRGSKTKPKPIVMNTTNGPKTMAHSPRTARRNMLSTELTESLRRNLLWERQQKSQTATAFLKRSRNAQSMANLQGAGGPSAPDRNHQSWNHEFENPWEFNAKPW